MKYSLLLLSLVSLQAVAKECSYPDDPINWIARYCAYEIESDDEIAIQESSCYKAAEIDLKVKDECKIKEKYKIKTCEKFLMKTKKYKSLKDCLKDPAVKPFFAGS